MRLIEKVLHRGGWGWRSQLCGASRSYQAKAPSQRLRLWPTTFRRVVHFLLPLLLCSLDIRQRRNSLKWVFQGRSRVMWQILRTQSQAISQNYQQDGNDASDAVSLRTLGADCAVVGVLSDCCCLCCMPLALAVAVAVATVTHVGHATLRKICLWCHKSIRIANDGDGEGDVTVPSAPGGITHQAANNLLGSPHC